MKLILHFIDPQNSITQDSIDHSLQILEKRLPLPQREGHLIDYFNGLQLENDGDIGYIPQDGEILELTIFKESNIVQLLELLDWKLLVCGRTIGYQTINLRVVPIKIQERRFSKFYEDFIGYKLD